MQMAAKLVIASVCLGHMAGAASLYSENDFKVNPLAKVTQLLNELSAKITKDGAIEDKAYEEYRMWCLTSNEDKAHQIKVQKNDMEDLSSTIGKADADVAAASAKMEDLTAAVGSADSDLEAAIAIRKKGKAAFDKAADELKKTIKTLGQAINIMKKKGSSFTQVDTRDVNALVKTLRTVVDAEGLNLHDEKNLAALVQAGSDSDDEDEELGAPAKATYTSKSTGLTDVLEDLKDKAKKNLQAAQDEEGAAKHNFQMLKGSLTTQMNADNKELAEEKENNNNAADLKASTTATLGATKKANAEDETALEELNSGCRTAANDHDTSVKSRGEELGALAAATKSLTDKTKKAGGSTYSFLQLSTQADLKNFEVVNLVKNMANKYSSPNLLQLAGRIQSVMKYGASNGADPLKKVKGLIADMITKLEKEAGGEAKKKAYCDKEYAATKKKNDDLTTNINKKSATIDKKTAVSQKLHDTINQQQADLTELQKTGMEMTTARTEANKAYFEKKTDLEQGLEGVRMALKVLREYYAASAASLMQDESESEDEAPSAPKSHSKSGGASTGIIGMLEVIESDFGRNLASGNTNEDAAAEEYEKTVKTNANTKKSKENDVKKKTKEVTKLDKQITDLQTDRTSSQSELDAVVEYKGTIDKTCVVIPETYAERVAKRNSEISGLKEALTSIDPADAFIETMLLQKNQKGLRGTAVSRHQ